MINRLYTEEREERSTTYAWSMGSSSYTSATRRRRIDLGTASPEPSRCQAKPTGQGSTRAGAGRVLFGQVADESRRFRGESGRGEALSGSFLGRGGPFYFKTY